MASKSVVEKFWEVNPESEIWWDSSPLIYEKWRNNMMNKASDKEEMQAWLNRLYSEDNKPEDNLFRGVTTNPPLSYNAIKDDPDYWSKWIDEHIQKERCTDTEVVFWDTYKEIVKRGSQTYMPKFEASNYKYGMISGQVDPRIRHDADKMFAQGLEIHALSPNVMIKVPGTAEGYEVIKRLTAKGIPTNNTLSFMISQFVACMNAVVEGMKEAQANGIDLSQWRSVITAMSSRFGELGDLEKDAQDKGIDLSESDMRWAEIAVFKKACRLVEENSEYPGKMLLCSMRMSPIIDGNVRSWHIEKVAGANAVYTCPPSYIEGLFFKANHIDFSDQVHDPVPQDVMDKLMKIPYFEKSYAEDGYTAEEFNQYPPLLETARQFSGATQEMVDFVGSRVAKFSK
ncbi:MAG: transaldolase [Deltaproteobacteria bacterium]|nr:transaldolase [Deltaproteobacteria bacterium]